MVVRGGLILALAAASLAAVPDAARAATWVEIKSPHFVVLSDAGERRAREVSWQFEQIRAAIVKLWPWATVDFPLPVTVYAARDERGMKALVPKYFEGRGSIRPMSVFVSAPFGHYAAVRSDLTLDSTDTVNPYRSSYWSYVALVIRTSFGRNLPLWYTRGLAEVFSNTIVRDQELLVGHIIPSHLQFLRGFGRPTLEAVLAADAKSEYMTNGERLAEFDAAAWGLVHYLTFGNKGQNLERMNQLSYALRQGADPNEALSHVYGGVQAVRDGMSRYIDQLLFVYQKIPANVDVDAKGFVARELSAVDSAARLARLHMAMNRPIEARAQIAAAAASPAAAEVDGLLLDGDGKHDEARAAYARASDASAASFYGEFRLATLSWPGRNAPDAETRFAAIEKSLRRSVALNARFAPAHAMLAQTLVRLNRAADALPFAQQAVTLSPIDSYGHESLARVYWALSKRDEAFASAKRALGYADREETRNSVKQLLDFFAKPTPAPAAAAAPGQVIARSNDSVAADQHACEAGDLVACSRVFPAAEEACRRRVSRACGAAAYLLAEGRGVSKDTTKAMALLEQPCEEGSFESCTQLATLLARRQAAADLTRARELLDKSCKGGLTAACDFLKGFPQRD